MAMLYFSHKLSLRTTVDVCETISDPKVKPAGLTESSSLVRAIKGFSPIDGHTVPLLK